MSRDVLTDLERGHEDCVLKFADGAQFRLAYLSIRCRCQCAKCKPRQENEQRLLEFEEEVARLRVEKPRRASRPLRLDSTGLRDAPAVFIHSLI